MSLIKTGNVRLFAEMDPDGVDDIKSVKCVCVATTQRSGSTMLAGELNATRVLGKVQEHVQGLVKDLKNNTLPTSVSDWMSRGQIGASGVFGLKVMVSQLPILGAWITPPKDALKILKDNKQDAFEEFSRRGLDWLRGAAEIHFIRLERGDVFAQAYSRIRARQSGMYHKFDNGKTIGHGGHTDVAPDTLNVAEIAAEIAVVLEERVVLARLLPEQDATTTALLYEDIVSQDIDVAELVAKAVGQAMTSGTSRNNRTTKIVSSDELDHAKAFFARTLHLDVGA